MKIDDNPNLKVVNGVIIFEDKTYFLRQKESGQRQFDYLTGESRLLSKDIENFISNIHYNEAFCKTYNIKYAHVIFPCKAVAYRERFMGVGVAVTPIVTKFHLSNQNVFLSYSGNNKRKLVLQSRHALLIHWLFKYPERSI
ncbi:hypothetical protein [Pseudoalteromonas agarivorans]|nr:hypothetical protein [Pseudoalteromonas telluritireducens]